jgi:CDP-diglyceride synthetase
MTRTAVPELGLGIGGLVSQAARPHLSRKVIWNFAIGVAGIGYILMTLWLNVESPLFAVLLITAAGHEIFESQFGRRRP